MKCSILLVFATSLAAATLDGVPIHYTATGAGPRTVILVHGWTCDETSWELQVPDLSRTYRVVTIDLPGHGKSPEPRDGAYSIDLFARAVEAVREEVKADRVVLGGHSMGAAVVAWYAHRNPQHSVALVFVDGYFGTPETLHAKPKLVESEPRERREKMIRWMFSEATTPAIREHILSMMLRPTEATARGAVSALLNPPAWGHDTLGVPVLGIYQDGGNFSSAHIPDFHLVRIRSAGHFLMMEKPAEFNRIFLDFLARQKY